MDNIKVDAKKVDSVKNGGPEKDKVASGYKHDGRPLGILRGEISLDPQPSSHPDDPLNWPLWGRIYIALTVSSLGFISQMGSALINPAYVVMSKDLRITVEQASYCTTIFILFSGVFPIFVVPFSNVYGRRIIYLTFTTIAMASQIGSGAAKTYGGVIAGRVFYGIGGGIPLGLGAATICDLFTQGERGLYLGIYTLCVNNGPHIAPIVGGYIALNLSWRWCFFVPGIIQGGLLVITVFTFPETLYSRTELNTLGGRSYISKLGFRGKVLKRKIRPMDFITPYRMVKYAAVSLPSIYWMTANTYGSALFAVTGSHLAAKLYHFNVAQTGLLMGLPLTIGCMLGEATAGWVSDRVINVYAMRHSGYRKPEVRLALLPGCATLSAGVIAYGPCVQSQKPWVVLAVCMAVAGFGLQIGATMVYTYATDCYKPQSAETGAVINLYKSVFAFTIGFYAVPFGENAGWNVSFPVLGMINGLTLFPLIFLWFEGEKVRERQGRPHIHEDL
ncbi:MFS general substrate transporter [Glonium stellatum]|uniref:MFS general substrate transporter n=1 Tax=Glonium stellatum TaxID=574774 RepID=A0A8E2JLR7_9PEZI|nr:MFS general substrate transporter [Glonium stellatum]